MSIKNNTIVENEQFVRNLVDVCGTDGPAELSRFLDVSYQGAKNYLEGRLPEAKVLITIVEKTKCSLNWLLTGEGEKFTNGNKRVNLDETFRAVIREIVQQELDFRENGERIESQHINNLSPEILIGLRKFVESENTNDNLTPQTREALKKLASEVLKDNLIPEEQYKVANLGKVNEDSKQRKKRNAT